MVEDGVKIILGLVCFVLINVVGLVMVGIGINVLFFFNNFLIVGGNVFVLGVIF